MTAYSSLMLHLSRHAYKRGQYKGDAPADPERRSKSHFRVEHHSIPDTYTVRFHYTDILTAFADGRVMLHTNGWHSSPTTRVAMNYALSLANMPRIFSSTRRSGLSQPVLHGYGAPAVAPLRYYDGMIFDAQHNLITEPRPFEKRVTNRDETRAFREDATAFRAMLPILHAGSGWDKYQAIRHTHQAHNMRNRTDDIFIRYDESAYPDIVAAFYAETWQETWRSIYQAATRRMMMVVPADS